MVRTLTETFDVNDLTAVRRLEEAEKAGAFVAESRVGDDGRIARVLAPDSRGGKRAEPAAPVLRQERPSRSDSAK